MNVNEVAIATVGNRTFDVYSMPFRQLGSVGRRGSESPNRLVNIDKNIRFVDNFLANQFFDDIFECKNAKGAMIHTRKVGNEYHMRLALLKEVDNVEAACIGRSLW